MVASALPNQKMSSSDWLVSCSVLRHSHPSHVDVYIASGTSCCAPPITWSASCDALVQSTLSGRGCCLGSALPGPLYLINVQLVDHRLWYAIQNGQIRHFSIMTGMPIRLSDFKLAPSDQQTHEVHVGDLDLQSLTARCYRSGGFVVP